MNQPIAKLPLALVRDTVQLLLSAKHADYALKDAILVVNALNQFAEAAVREHGSSLHSVDAPAESDTSQPPPI